MITLNLKWLNFLFGAIGVVGIWLTTHSWPALIFGFIGAIHIDYKLNKQK